MPPMDFCRFSPHWGMQSIPNFSGDLLHLTYWGPFKYSSPVHWVRKPSFNLLSLMNIRVWSVYAEFPPAYICVCHRFQAESSPFSQHFIVTLSSVAISGWSRPHWSLCRTDTYICSRKSCFPLEWGLWAGFCPWGYCNLCSLSWALGLCRAVPALEKTCNPCAPAELLCGIKTTAQCLAIFPVLLTKICAGFFLWGRMCGNINTYAWKHILWEPASREQSSEWLWIRRLIWHLSMHS